MFTDEISAEDRDKLYDEVWTEAMYKVAPKYHTSAATLKKKCDNWDIPVPGAGYWARTQAGYKDRKLELREIPKGRAKYLVYGYSVSYKLPLEQMSEKDIRSDEELIIYSERTKSKLTKIRENTVVPNKLINSHPYIESHQKRAEERKKHNKDANWKTLRIDIPASQFDRAYRILNTMFLITNDMEGGVCLPQFANTPGDGGLIYIDKHEWFFWMNQSENGPLTLSFDSRGFAYSYSHEPDDSDYVLKYFDKPGIPLEDQVGEIIYTLFVYSGKQVQAEELACRKKSLTTERQEHLKQMEPLIKAEQNKLLNILSESALYRKAQDLRSYAAAYYENAQKDGDHAPDVEAHYRWMLDRADWLDPLIDIENELLTETFKDTLK